MRIMAAYECHRSRIILFGQQKSWNGGHINGSIAGGIVLGQLVYETESCEHKFTR